MITEERLAALEAQMAALVEPPTEYYTSRYSGEEIDKGIDGALQLGGASTPQGAIAALGAGVRPNLLVNPFFKVNQRGNASYTGIVPTVDCWKSNSATLTVQVTDDGVLLSGTGFDYLKNYIESPEQYNGKTITVSALVKNPGGQFRINLYNESKQVSNNFNIPASSDWVIISGTIHGVQASSGDKVCLLLYPGGGIQSQTATAQVMATKVEEGETQTLGYIDSSGNPVLLERPDPLELVKCKRYLYIIPAYYSLPARVDGSSRIQAVLQTPAKMRIKPTVPSSAYFLDSTGQYSCTLTDTDVSDFGVRLLGTTTVQGKGGVLFFATQATISAEF
jgi:hypothetical protein